MKIRMSNPKESANGGGARSFGRHDRKHLHLANGCNGNQDLKISQANKRSKLLQPTGPKDLLIRNVKI